MFSRILKYTVGKIINNPSLIDPAMATHTIPLSMGVAAGEGNMSTVQPGDIVALQSGTRGILRLEDFHGTPQNPIIFVNDGGVVNITASSGNNYAGIDIRRCTNIRVTGCGAVGGIGRAVGKDYQEHQQDAGIKVHGNGVERGVAIKHFQNFTTMFPNPGIINQNIEIDHIEIGPITKIGFHAPPDGSNNHDPVDFDDRYTLVGYDFHNLYIHDCETGEGMYLGANDYAFSNVAYIGGFDIYNNLIIRPGRDSIKLASAPEPSFIHHNVLLDTGQSLDNYQRSYFLAHSGGTRMAFYNNICRNAGAEGINGRGIQLIAFNNVIDTVALVTGNPDYLQFFIDLYGEADGTSEANRNVRAVVRSPNDGEMNWAIDKGHITDDKSSADFVWNNLVRRSKSNAMHFSYSYSDANRYHNNILRDNGNDNINVSGSSGAITISHSLTSNPLWVNEANNNYLLQSGSPALGAALNIQEINNVLPDWLLNKFDGNMAFDLLDRSRPQSGLWTAGPYEGVG